MKLEGILFLGLLLSRLAIKGSSGDKHYLGLLDSLPGFLDIVWTAMEDSVEPWNLKRSRKLFPSRLIPRPLEMGYRLRRSHVSGCDFPE